MLKNTTLLYIKEQSYRDQNRWQPTRVLIHSYNGKYSRISGCRSGAVFSGSGGGLLTPAFPSLSSEFCKHLIPCLKPLST